MKIGVNFLSCPEFFIQFLKNKNEIFYDLGRKYNLPTILFNDKMKFPSKFKHYFII